MPTFQLVSWRVHTWRERRRNERRMSAIARKLAGIELQSSTGERVRMGTLWERGPIVLAFIRHFG